MTPKAHHLVTLAMREADPNDRAIWGSADRDTSEELPVPAIHAAVRALHSYGERLDARLNNPGISEDDASDASNDLSYVRDLEHGLLE